MGRFLTLAALCAALLLLADECNCFSSSTNKNLLSLRKKEARTRRRDKAKNEIKGLGVLIPPLPKLEEEEEPVPVHMKLKGEIKFNPCTRPNLCFNGGECVSTGDSYYCKCSDRYVGKRCQYEKNVHICNDNLCKNGAVCIPVDNPRFVMHPDHTINPQESVGNIGHTFTDLTITVSYSCICKDGFFGSFCEQSEAQRCADDYCNYHGIPYEDNENPMTTTVTGNSSSSKICKCQCEAFYSGDRCQYISPCIDFTGQAECQFCIPCVSNPEDIASCISEEDKDFREVFLRDYNRVKERGGVYNNECNYHGTCEPQIHRYDGRSFLLPVCECTGNDKEGWTGRYCTERIEKEDVCKRHDDICGKHGTCVSRGSQEKGYFACKCNEGYTGQYCSVEDPCRHSPCGNGTLCVALFDEEAVKNDISFACVCSMDQEVENEEEGKQKSQFCAENSQCGNGRKDLCKEGYCLPCGINEAHGNGLCSEEEKKRGYRCICPMGASGHDCGGEVDPCTFHECENNGVCQPDGFLDYKCDCTKTNYLGTYCEIPKDVCKGDGKLTCVHGECVPDNDFRRGFRCKCSSNYEGVDCDREKNTDFKARYLRNYRYTYPATMLLVLLPLAIIAIVCDRMRVCRADNMPKKGGHPEEGLKGEAESDLEGKDNKPKASKIKAKKQPVGVLPPGGGQRIVF
ncbi:hypothetical protein QR680_012416 [Steinernema hermaphroditum]|uniref:EGF-like domain-containing protein n=1 Tax=Steinernema hermaphroditum TaxID=289476 RepID=A0AA39I4A0_9BILA|nr:hypothetical protein QR680_012416 [Steinernema hermaphroditum]